MTLTLTEGESITFETQAPSDVDPIQIDPEKTYQTILGMGSSLDHATCHNLHRLAPEKRTEVMARIVSPAEGIGMNLMRVCIGTSDFAPLPYYSYDDLPPGEADPELAQFVVEKDREYVLPTLKLAMAKNPGLVFFASPWSPPAWMKKGENLCGGAMDAEHFADYARYLVRFIRAYEAEGIAIHAITPQNEPGMVSKDYPTCLWSGTQQRDFIRDALGPEFARQNIATRIWCFDHNFNNLPFPRAVLSDANAALFVEGTAFHHYEGKVEAMSELHTEFPDKRVHFTEGSTFGVSGARTIIEIFRNWAESYTAWVTMLDQDQQPNSGPHHASPTCIVLNTDDLSVEYRFDYYMYGQFMKFVQRGAVRIDSSAGDRSFSNVAFKNPDGSIVLVVANRMAERPFRILCGGLSAFATVPAKSVATYVWQP
ncbi:MAG TPA: glycoside hydrolase family 30 beta sandwich domain-containing protein [Candidatus Hydrogenedentes bacterium]|nr:glycoside hydrolase family 30 beta sandwich domain-containing protein [Candidatus Hydrogenedentota bacterium]HPG65223.1 glycoside hydrolase family 30 beta sandwich domain-containing protein [Candidatus Hydrogenedentota bacterium]